MREFTVRAEWDAEAGVWYVAESDVPGLVAEADTVEHLFRDVLDLVPELLELNFRELGEPIQGAVPLKLLAAQHMAVQMR